MKRTRKYALSLIAFVWLAYALLPAAGASAARVFQFEIFAGSGGYMIAGEPYSAIFDSDKSSTTRTVVYFSYSVNNGATWSSLPIQLNFDNYFDFRIPIQPDLTSALFRVGVKFIPLIGADSYSESIAGPFKILQPIAPSNVKATANDDGTVTLSWDDNSNMEQAYRITRYGPDGTKVFTAGNTTDYVGPVVYRDKNTNTSKDTIYVYSLSMDIPEKYGLPAHLDPGTVHVSIKTKAPIKPPDPSVVTDTAWITTPWLEPIVLAPKPSDYLVIDDASLQWSDIMASQYLWDQLNKGNRTLPAHPVSGVTLGSRSVSIRPGEVIALLASVQPAEAANKKLSWSSDNPAVATVNAEGRLTGISPGTAKITVKTEEGGFSDACVVTVASSAEEEGLIMPSLPSMTDLTDHPASGEIVEALASGFVNGYPDGTFRPDASVTRAEFAAMLMRGMKTEDAGTALTFKDRAAIGEWAATPVAQAVQLGIINGYGDHTFRPNAHITRAEMITMVMRASGQNLELSNEPTPFADDAAIPDWARPSVSKAQVTGIIIVGGIDASFEPEQLASRAEAASAIVRMLKIRN